MNIDWGIVRWYLLSAVAVIVTITVVFYLMHSIGIEP